MGDQEEERSDPVVDFTHTHGMTFGSGTTSALAINAFKSRVERNRTRDRKSDRSARGSIRSMSRANSGRHSTTAFVGAVVVPDAHHPLPLASLADAHPSGFSAPPSEPAQCHRPSSSPVALDLVQSVINASPGCYAGDDGSVEISDRYNFYVHGKRFLVRPYPCFSITVRWLHSDMASDQRLRAWPVCNVFARVL